MLNSSKHTLNLHNITDQPNLKGDRERRGHLGISIFVHKKLRMTMLPEEMTRIFNENWVPNRYRPKYDIRTGLSLHLEPPRTAACHQRQKIKIKEYYTTAPSDQSKQLLQSHPSQQCLPSLPTPHIDQTSRPLPVDMCCHYKRLLVLSWNGVDGGSLLICVI